MNEHIPLFDFAINEAKKCLKRWHHEQRRDGINKVQIKVVTAFQNEVVRVIARNARSRIAHGTTVTWILARVNNRNDPVVAISALLHVTVTQPVSH